MAFAFCLLRNCAPFQFCIAGRGEPFLFSARRIKIRFASPGSDKIVSAQISIQAVRRKRFLKSCDSRKRCLCLGDSFLPRPSDLNFALPLPFDFGAKRERSQFNKNQNTLFKIIFFIFSAFLRNFRASFFRGAVCAKHNRKADATIENAPLVV